MTDQGSRDPASFRDPDGYVFTRGDRVFRALRKGGADSYRALRKSGLADVLEKDKMMTVSWEVDRVDLGGHDIAGDDICMLVEQEKVPVVSYPFEWSFDMLRDAAILSLDVLKACSEFGFVLKDATAYNVQFVGSRPIFIDLLSIKPYVQNQPWTGYAQFCQNFLYPLAVDAIKKLPCQSLLRTYLNGMPVEATRNILGVQAFTSWGMVKHVGLQSLLQRSFGGKQQELVSTVRSFSFSLEHIVALSDDMRRMIGRMSKRSDGSAWSMYQDERLYSHAALERKKRFVRKHLERLRPHCVLDLGCNTGEFSLLAAQYGQYVVAMDADESCVNEVYRNCKKESKQGILPLVMDITNPTPSQGWELCERPSVFDRVQPDCVLMLALIHHLCIAANIQLSQIVSLLKRLGARSSIVEFVPKTDPMVKRLLATREDVFDWYDERRLLEEASKDFDVVEREQLEDAGRTVYCLERKR